MPCEQWSELQFILQSWIFAEKNIPAPIPFEGESPQYKVRKEEECHWLIVLSFPFCTCQRHHDKPSEMLRVIIEFGKRLGFDF